jgi:phosphatidylserine/phosphatidylglycerophosphate/cardiolipin synthase-like enzyme
MRIRHGIKTLVVLLAAAVAVRALRADRLDPVPPVSLPPGVAVYFNPQDDIKARVRALIAAARTEILVNQYAITDPDIAADLVDAYKLHHVFVAVILEERPAVTNYSTPQYFLLNDINVVVYEGPGCNNQKYLIIDRELVVTGSYDLTLAAAHDNLENIFVAHDAGVAAAFYNNWCRVARLCKVPTPK